MKKTLEELKSFLLRGNVVDLAVAVVVGAAFGEVVKALVSDFITPILGIFGGVDFGGEYFEINHSKFMYGHFLNVLISFVSIATAIFFFVVKPMNMVLERRKKKEEPEQTTRECPQCISTIPVEAKRCAFCTSQL